MAVVEDQELLQMFVEESREHLDGIESSFLEIEEMGEDVDADLVNGVFRAIHSVKGGAGFLGLEVIKDLAHSMENVLNQIRNRRIIPTPELVSVLLSSLDVLKDLIENVEESGEVDVSEQLAALEEVVRAQQNPSEEGEDVTAKEEKKEENESASATESNTAAELETQPNAGTATESIQENTVSGDSAEQIELKLPHGHTIFKRTPQEFQQARKGGKFLYVAIFNWEKDLDKKERCLEKQVADIKMVGTVLEQKIDLEAIPELEMLSPSVLVPFYVLFATVLEPYIIPSLISIPKKQIFLVTRDYKLISLDKESEISDALADDVSSESVEEVKEEKISAPEQKEKSAPKTEEQPKTETPKNTKKSKKTVEQKAASSGGDGKSAEAGSKPAKTLPRMRSVISKSSTLRVHVDLLDRLMNLAGELVLTRNQLLQNFYSHEEKGLENAVQRVDLITSELQEAIMSTRMQPIGIVFNKFQRVVHDLSKSLGKQVTLITEGEDVELDKTIIEAIGDPLTHLVRNAVDHGIEMPEVRLQQGKKLPATVKLSAKHEAGQVIIQVADDGAGIDPEKIRQKALQLKLAPKAKLESMPDNEVIRFIFQPGFSTAEKVTDVSGRGVGMDVVYSNLSRLGGSVDIESRVGKGTTILIKLPLTLAIIPSLIVGVQGLRFALPQVNLVELVRIPAAKVKERIEKIDDAAVLRLRGELLPLIRISDALQMQRKILNPVTGEYIIDRRQLIYDRRSPCLGEENTPPPPVEDKRKNPVDRRHHIQSAYNIVVVNAGELHFGLIVDELLDSEEIVVKPLGRHLRNIPTYAGATILGDGRAALILDVAGISSVMELKVVKDKAKEKIRHERMANIQDAQSLLLVKNASDEQFGIPLGLISRLEKIHRDDIEYTSGKQTIKYRGGTLILCNIEDVANVKPREDVEYPYILIFPFAGKEVGIVVSEILDVVEYTMRIDEETFRQPGILGSAIIGGETTLLLNVYEIFSTVLPEWVKEKKEVHKKKQNEQATILLVEDSRFFLNQVKGFTEDAGYHVLTALDGVLAMEILNNPEYEVDIVLTDIEMPNMDGIELTRQIRQHSRYAQIPVIALTSVAAEEVKQQALDAGVDDYLIKLDRENVLERIAYFLKKKRQQA